MLIFHFYTLSIEIIKKFWFSDVLWGTEVEYWLKTG